MRPLDVRYAYATSDIGVDESGWAWYIPLHDGTISVGIVEAEDCNRRKKNEVKDGCPSDDALRAHYLRELELVPTLATGIWKSENPDCSPHRNSRTSPPPRPLPASEVWWWRVL